MSSYAFVPDGVTATEVALPSSARRLDNQEWVLGLPTAPQALREAAGYFEVVTTTPTEETPTQLPVRSIAMVGGVATEVWSLRDKTTDELGAQVRNTNMASLITKGKAAFALNQTFLGLASPTNVQVRDQVQLLTREMNGVLKLLLSRLGEAEVLDDTTGT